MREALKGKYALEDIHEGVYIYNFQVSDKKPDELLGKIKHGTVTVKTDLDKCVGGLPVAGSYVRAYIVIKSGETVKTVLHPELNQLQVLSVQNDQAAAIDSNSGQANGSSVLNSSSTKSSIPAHITFNTAAAIQETLLINGMYEGEVHLSLLNPGNVDPDFDKKLNKLPIGESNKEVAPEPKESTVTPVPQKKNNQDSEKDSNGGGITIQ